MITREFDDIFSSGEGFPRVSVVIPLYNYGHMIRETLDCLKDQEFKDFALVIVNDKSTDNSLEVARQWCEENVGHFTRIRLISNQENGGLSVARNTGISATTSDYIFFLDADNLIYPRCLARLVEALDRSPAAFAFSMLEVFGGRKGVIGTRIFDIDLLAIENYIDAMAMIRRSALIAIDGYRVMKFGWEDYELWLRLAEGGMTGIQVPELLGRYRSHSTSMSNTTTATNNEAVKRQIKELHPWVQVFGVPDFLPRRAASWWGQIVRYGGIVNRLIRSRVRNRRELRHLTSHFYTTYRARGARGLAAELRALEAAALRGRKHLDVEQVRWVPQFAGAEASTCDRALLPFDLPQASSPTLALVYHVFDASQIEELKALIESLSQPCDLYVSVADEATRRLAVKTLGQATSKLTLRIAAWVKHGFEPAFAIFADALASYDGVLLAHGDAPGGLAPAGSWGRAQREALTQHAAGIVSAFEADPALGLVAIAGGEPTMPIPAEPVLKWAIAYCSLRVDPTSRLPRPPGSMFWFRPQALRPYRVAELTAEQLASDNENGAALLALLYLACENAGFNWLEATVESHGSARRIGQIGDFAQVTTI